MSYSDSLPVWITATAASFGILSDIVLFLSTLFFVWMAYMTFFTAHQPYRATSWDEFKPSLQPLLQWRNYRPDALFAALVIFVNFVLAVGLGPPQAPWYKLLARELIFTVFASLLVMQLWAVIGRHSPLSLQQRFVANAVAITLGHWLYLALVKVFGLNTEWPFVIAPALFCTLVVPALLVAYSHLEANRFITRLPGKAHP